MTALEVITRKGYNPFKTEMVKKDNVYTVYEKGTHKVIVKFAYTPDGRNHKILAK